MQIDLYTPIYTIEKYRNYMNYIMNIINLI